MRKCEGAVKRCEVVKFYKCILSGKCAQCLSAGECAVIPVYCSEKTACKNVCCVDLYLISVFPGFQKFVLLNSMF